MNITVNVDTNRVVSKITSQEILKFGVFCTVEKYYDEEGVLHTLEEPKAAMFVEEGVAAIPFNYILNEIDKFGVQVAIKTTPHEEDFFQSYAIDSVKKGEVTIIDDTKYSTLQEVLDKVVWNVYNNLNNQDK